MKRNTLASALHMIFRSLELIHLGFWLFEVARWLYLHAPFIF